VRYSRILLIVLAIVAWALPAVAQPAKVDTSKYKELYSTLSADERAVYERALAREWRAEMKKLAAAPRPEVLDEGDTCIPATGPSTAFPPAPISSTTVGATNNYDIATVCGTGQTLFGGTGAAADRAYAIEVDANCTITATADPTGASWDLAMYVLAAPGAACTQLPSLADGQCITMDDNGGGDITETVTWAATAGTQYFMIIDGFNTATGTFGLTFSAVGACNLVPVELLDAGVN
jgi:hypothetical protein